MLALLPGLQGFALAVVGPPEELPELVADEILFGCNRIPELVLAPELVIETGGRDVPPFAAGTQGFGLTVVGPPEEKPELVAELPIAGMPAFGAFSGGIGVEARGSSAALGGGADTAALGGGEAAGV